QNLPGIGLRVERLESPERDLAARLLIFTAGHVDAAIVDAASNVAALGRRAADIAPTVSLRIVFFYKVSHVAGSDKGRAEAAIHSIDLAIARARIEMIATGRHGRTGPPAVGRRIVLLHRARYEWRHTDPERLVELARNIGVRPANHIDLAV